MHIWGVYVLCGRGFCPGGDCPGRGGFRPGDVVRGGGVAESGNSRNKLAADAILDFYVNVNNSGTTHPIVTKF